jgi:hypothetical protein
VVGGAVGLRALGQVRGRPEGGCRVPVRLASGPVEQRGYRVTARRADGHHLIEVTPAHPVRTQPGHSGHDRRHQPDRTAEEITTDYVSIRIVTGDAARLPAPARKPPEYMKVERWKR